ncbi:hypothetical protein [Streptosporangium sp. NPDC049078]|uniref:hypothetical protein n=1 Tax=Streptosporangium sp. NPDC049078 TaxID=3155767 RepID=UPI003414E886
MTAQLDANAFLMGGGIPSAKFETIGATVGGRITCQPEVTQQTDLDTGEPKTWSDGKPMMQLVVTVQTELRDPEVPDDDGQRKFYVKAKLLEAVRQAVRAAGAAGLEVGGTLTVQYVADGEAKKRGHNPPKIYAATYQRPTAVQANAFLQGAPAAPAAPVYAPPAPAAAPVAQPAPVAAWTAPPGMDPTQAAAIAQLTPDQRAALGFA